ncbi:MAG: hypothetical protein JSV88_28825 [Candidatus Aminicenantes bacterium]|nr:MAG: hypothetical protein JSV88_28825 [Candidatus Aminicenantes bacterium]
MKKNALLFIILMMCITGMLTLTTTSCKRSKVDEPGMIPNAGFRISLSGTANPSTLYVPETEPPVSSLITVRALHNDGSPAVGFDVIFQEGLFGFFDNYKNSIVKTTDTSGIVRANFFIPPGANIKASVMTNIIVTLVDDGRLDSTLARVEDVIPIQLVPYVTQGIIIHGHVLTPAGSGVEGVTIILDGDDFNADGVTVTRPSGSYEFYVAAGWYGTIYPSAPGYTFVPSSYVFDVTTPIIVDIMNLDFVAIFEGGNTLVADVTQWEVPTEGGTQVVNVYNGTGDSPIGYIVVPDSPWIHVSPNTGTTPDSFTITVDENTTGHNRSGTITISATDTQASSVIININQLGAEVPSDARLAVDKETVNVPYETTTVAINVYNSTTDDSISYIITITSENDWITVSSLSGTTPNSFTITVANNFGPARTGQVILTPTTTGVSNTVTITVNQEAGPSLALDFETKNVAIPRETFIVTVTNPTTSEAVPFLVTANATWISFTPASSSTPEEIKITVASNGTGLLRTGVVTFTGAIPNVPASDQPTVTLTITQQGS